MVAIGLRRVRSSQAWQGALRPNRRSLGTLGHKHVISVEILLGRTSGMPDSSAIRV